MFRPRKGKFDVEINNSLNFSICTDTDRQLGFLYYPEILAANQYDFIRQTYLCQNFYLPS